MMVRRTQDTNITEKLSMNQDIQWTAFPSPITRMVSFNLRNQFIDDQPEAWLRHESYLISFSWTMLLIIMEAE